VILWDAPASVGRRRSCLRRWRRIFDPKVRAFKDGRINWTRRPSLSRHPPEGGWLSAVRRFARGTFLTPGSIGWPGSPRYANSPLVVAEYNKGKHYTIAELSPPTSAKLSGGRGLILARPKRRHKPPPPPPLSQAKTWVEADGSNRPLPGDFMFWRQS